MDTLNINTGNSGSLGDEKVTSDEEDFKTGIPFLEETDGPMTTGTSYGIISDDDETPNYSQWQNDERDFDDETGTLMAINYDNASDYETNPTTNFFVQNSPASVSATSPSPSVVGIPPLDTFQDIKYTPNEMSLYPPSTTAMHYNYNYVPQRTMPPPLTTVQAQDFNHTQAHTMQNSSQQHRNNGGTSSFGPATYNQSAPNFHPNMWYPNAPYGGNRAYYGSQRYAQYNTNYPHDAMMDMLHLSNSGREARNRAEKNRRDKLNGSIQELSTMVPHVAESPRRVDKTAVLRFAAHGLRLQYVFSDTANQQRPQLTDSLMKLLDSFFITLTCHGQIVLISSSIEQHLGHCQTDLYGQSILHITHPEDHNMLKKQLIPSDLDSLFDVQPEDESGEPRIRTEFEEEYIDRRLREDKRSFTVRLARAGPRSEPTTYEVVKIDGCFRRSDAAPRGVKTSTFPSTLQLIRRSRGRDDSIPLHTISGNDIVLVAIARIIRPPKIVSRLTDPNRLEYRTRHLIDGRIIDCDQRIGLVAGYMTDEVRNLSPFTFMHQDDARWVIVALRQMYDCHSSYGESTYRLLTRNGHFIYLQSKGYLEIDKNTNEVRSFICINTLLDDEEGKRRVQEMKKKFSIIINANIPQSSIDAPASENPQQLEKAVMCLIQNLKKSLSDDEDTDTSDTLPASRNMQPAVHQSEAQASNHSCTRSAKTPPLALVPPEPSSVKTSIFQSASVVNVTAAKHFRELHSRVKSPLSPEDGSEVRYNLDLNASSMECTCKPNSSTCNHCQQNIGSVNSPSTGIKRNVSDLEEEDVVLPKRRLKSEEIEQVLSTSLDQIGRTLNQQLNAAIELRDRSNKYEVPNTNLRIEEIMEEHQKQSEMYVNIKNEYEVQRHSNKVIDVNTTKPSDSKHFEDSNSNFKSR